MHLQSILELNSSLRFQPTLFNFILMNFFISTIVVLGVVFGHTQAAPNPLLGLSRPKYPSSALDTSSLDLDSLDLDSLGNYDNVHQQLGYVQDVLPITSTLQDALPIKGYNNKRHRKTDLSSLLDSYGHLNNLANDQLLSGNVKDLYSTTTGALSHGALKDPLSTVYSATDAIPLLSQSKQDYETDNQVFKLPSGQELHCVVA